MIKQIIDKQTKLFVRDDFTFNPVTESALEVEPAQGLYAPKWNGKSWEESLTVAEIEATKVNVEPIEPTIEERITVNDGKIATLEESIDAIFGGV